MKTLLLGIALLPTLLLADGTPSGWSLLKDRTGNCQIAAPADFKPDRLSPGLAKGPGDAMEVAVYPTPS